jgi:hypothetical protein
MLALQHLGLPMNKTDTTKTLEPLKKQHDRDEETVIRLRHAEAAYVEIMELRAKRKNA